MAGVCPPEVLATELDDLRVFGLGAFRAAVAHRIALAEHAELLLPERPGWEVVTPVQLAIVCFRRDGDDALQTRIAAAMVADGYAAPSTTEVGGRVALRLCTINPRTTFEDVERTIAHMERYPVLPPRLDSRHATFYE